MKKSFKKLIRVRSEIKNVKDDIKLKVHCHISGKFRWSVHKDCNINLHCLTKFLFFHNLKGYSSHHIMREI